MKKREKESTRFTLREMVAQDMAQSYDQLFRTSQEPQEFISLEELAPPPPPPPPPPLHSPLASSSSSSHRINHRSAHRSREHEWVSTSSTSAHLYASPSSTRHNENPTVDDPIQQQQQQHQQRTYYNLSSALQQNLCRTVYFGEIGENSKIAESGRISDRTDDDDDDGDVDDVDDDDHDDDDDDILIGDNDSHFRGTTNLSKNESSNKSGHRRRRRHHQQHRKHESRSKIDEISTSINETRTDARTDFSPVTGKKRKISYHDDDDLTDATGDESKSINRPIADSKKQNHSEIEKRRRDKMNTYITELSAMVPMCHAMSRKLDKLTVLRLAVQHLKTILGAVTSYTEVHYKPTFISDEELKTLILQVAEGFVFVVGCDQGRILYVSESVAQTLNYSQDELLGQSWFDILHPKDVAKVKEQLSSSDLSPRAKTMLPVKTDIPQGVSRLCPGARRSFFCRMKRKFDVAGCGVGVGSGGDSQVKEEADTTSECHRRKKQQSVDWKYCVIHCTGYLKSWAPAKIRLEEHEGDGDGEGCRLSCLVAVGRIQPGLPALSSGPTIPRLRTIEFISRHAIDGKFLFVDQRATLVLGFLPQELLGTSMYEYYHHDDIPHLADSHKSALQSTDRIITRTYRFRAKGSSFMKLQSAWKSFRNPWTKDIEYLISKNSAVYSDTRQVESSVDRSKSSSVKDNYDYFAQSNGGLERLISSHVEMSKIGRRIAEQALDNQRRNEDSCSVSNPNSGAPERASLNTEFQITTTVSPKNAREVSQQPSSIGNDSCSNADQTSTYSQIRNNVQLNSIANDQGTQPEEQDMMEIIGGTVMNESPNPLPSDGNDEAAMAVIMSLLEADAGLGGPVDFSGLPWPLP